jgi:hypothetical protein
VSGARTATWICRHCSRPCLIELYRDTFKNDLSRTNGDSSWTLPMPARYVIRTDGVIGYAEVNPDYTRRPDPEELLPALSALKSRVAA